MAESIAASCTAESSVSVALPATSAMTRLGAAGPDPHPAEGSTDGKRGRRRQGVVDGAVAEEEGQEGLDGDVVPGGQQLGQRWPQGPAPWPP